MRTITIATLAALLRAGCGDAGDHDEPEPTPTPIETVSACCYWTSSTGGVVRPPRSSRGCWSYEGPIDGVPQFHFWCGQAYHPPFGSAEIVIDEVCDESRTDGPCSRHFTE